MLDIISNAIGKGTSTESNSNKSIVAMLVDSAIIGGITALSVWDGQTATIYEVLPLIKAFGLSFLIQLAWYRGITKVKK